MKGKWINTGKTIREVVEQRCQHWLGQCKIYDLKESLINDLEKFEKGETKQNQNSKDNKIDCIYKNKCYYSGYSGCNKDCSDYSPL